MFETCGHGFYAAFELKMKNMLYIAVLFFNKIHIYDSNGLLKKIKQYCHNYDVSMDGMRIAIRRHNLIFVKNILDCDLETLFDISELSGIEIRARWIAWAKHGSKILYSRIQNDNLVVMNVNTSSRMEIYTSGTFFDDTFIDGGDYLIECFSDHVNVYNTSTLVFLKKINMQFNTIHYHVRLGVFVIDFECYRINSQYDFDKVVFGQNYVKDAPIVENTIMEIIFGNSLLSQLPMEILCVELYRELLIVY